MSEENDENTINTESNATNQNKGNLKDRNILPSGSMEPLTVTLSMCLKCD